MSDSEVEHDVTGPAMVYAYGVPADPSLNEFVRAEVERQRDLWDALVWIDRDAERDTEIAMRATDPEYDLAMTQIDDLSCQITGLIAERRRRRQRARAAVDVSDLDAEITPLVDQRRAARAATWARVKDWRRANADVVSAIETRRKARVKEARQKSPAWWPNYNRVLDDFAAARKRCRRTGGPDRPAPAPERRAHDWGHADCRSGDRWSLARGRDHPSGRLPD